MLHHWRDFGRDPVLGAVLNFGPSFYYLPVIIAGFLVGRRMAVWAAIFWSVSCPSFSALWTALEEIERGAGSTFASEVVRALRTATPIERVEGHSDSNAASVIKLA